MSPMTITPSARRSRPRRGVAGFTLVELAVTLVVVAILATIAAPSFTNLIASKRSKSAATALYIALTKARSEAIKRNVNVTIQPTTVGAWQSGWQIADANGNPIDTQTALAGVTISGAPANLTFQSAGRVQGTEAASFQITAINNSSAQSCVTTSLSGRPTTKASSC